MVELDRLAGEPLDILVNGMIIAKGEVVMVGERFGIRFSEIVPPKKGWKTSRAGFPAFSVRQCQTSGRCLLCDAEEK